MKDQLPQPKTRRRHSGTHFRLEVGTTTACIETFAQALRHPHHCEKPRSCGPYFTLRPEPKATISGSGLPRSVVLADSDVASAGTTTLLEFLGPAASGSLGSRLLDDGGIRNDLQGLHFDDFHDLGRSGDQVLLVHWGWSHDGLGLDGTRTIRGVGHDGSGDGDTEHGQNGKSVNLVELVHFSLPPAFVIASLSIFTIKAPNTAKPSFKEGFFIAQWAQSSQSS